jgi:predicted metal-binding protein
MTTWITVCETCKRPGWVPEADGLTDGERLADLIETAARDVPGLRVRRHACLMGCERACAVALQATGKMGYGLADFPPEPAMAQAVVTYAAHHARSRSGIVNWADWPEAVKPRFVSRHPPLPET